MWLVSDTGLEWTARPAVRKIGASRDLSLGRVRVGEGGRGEARIPGESLSSGWGGPSGSGRGGFRVPAECKSTRLMMGGEGQQDLLKA